MTDGATRRLLDAIHAFESEHGSDPKMKAAVAALRTVSAEITRSEPDVVSPGNRAAHEAASEASLPRNAEPAPPSPPPGGGAPFPPQKSAGRGPTRAEARKKTESLPVDMRALALKKLRGKRP